MKILTNHVRTIAKMVVVTLALTGFVSCKKNKDDQPVEPVGYWKGHYTATGLPQPIPVRVLVKSNGTARLYDMGIKTDTAAVSALDKYSATWLLNNQTLDVMFYSDAIRLFRGNIDPKTNTWSGTWMNNGVVMGTMTLTK
jgi:hypothetical protein